MENRQVSAESRRPDLRKGLIGAFLIAALVLAGVYALQYLPKKTPVADSSAIEFMGVVTEISGQTLIMDRFFLPATGVFLAETGHYESEELVLTDSAIVTQLAFNESEGSQESGDAQTIVINRADSKSDQATSSETLSYTGPVESPATIAEIHVGSKIMVRAVGDEKRTIESVKILPDDFILDPFALLDKSQLP